MGKQITFFVLTGFLFLSLIAGVAVPLTFNSTRTIETPGTNQSLQTESLLDHGELVDESYKEKNRAPRDCSSENISAFEKNIVKALEAQVTKLVDDYNNGKDYSPGFIDTTAKYAECIPQKPLKVDGVMQLFIETTVKKVMGEYKFESV